MNYARASHEHLQSVCQSQNQQEFNGEIAGHFPGLDGLVKPIVWVFPKVSVCLNCGSAEFAILEKELQVLRTGTPVEGAAVWLGTARNENPPI
jgi:hypothetical protein